MDIMEEKEKDINKETEEKGRDAGEKEQGKKEAAGDAGTPSGEGSPAQAGKEQAETGSECEAEGGGAEGASRREKEKKKVRKLEAKIAELEKKLKDAEAASAEKDGKYLLLYAEYDNFRRRSQKEKDGIYSEAYGDALKQILPIIDSLEMAEKQTGDADAIKAGVAMVLKMAGENLAKMGITQFGAPGEKFDPEKHTAVFHVDDDEKGENEIVEVLQKGYSRDGKIIRYAVVKVAN